MPPYTYGPRDNIPVWIGEHVDYARLGDRLYLDTGHALIPGTLLNAVGLKLDARQAHNRRAHVYTIRDDAGIVRHGLHLITECQLTAGTD